MKGKPGNSDKQAKIKTYPAASAFQRDPNLGQWIFSNTGSKPEASIVKGCALVSGSLLVHTEVNTRVGAEQAREYINLFLNLSLDENKTDPKWSQLC